LRELLRASLLEQVKKTDSDLAWVLETLKEFELIVDSYEQPRQRPTDYQEQKINKGGQEKNTKKNQVIVMPSGK
jgi:hypothetical protein